MLHVQVLELNMSHKHYSIMRELLSEKGGFLASVIDFKRERECAFVF